MDNEGVIFLKTYAKLALLIGVVLMSFYLWLHTINTKLISWENGKEETDKKESTPKDTTKKNEKKEQMVSITRQDGTLLELPLETYLEGVIGSEMPASFEMEALKAQCVAARTFVTKRNFEVDDTTATQVYHDDKQMRQIWGKNYDMYHARIVQALKETKGEILTYNGEVITAAFFSNSCGKTANAEEYWESATPYLRSVDSPWDKGYDDYEKVITFTKANFAKQLGFQKEVTKIEKPILYKSGYVNTIKIDEIVFSGRMIREKLGLRSSAFTIKEVKDGYQITTRGYGHGLGMSQDGAQGMALEGTTYKKILTHYYTGVKIEKKDV